MGSRQRRSAFTLLELLVVVGIIIVLFGVMTPALVNARERARTIVCVSNLRSIGTAVQSYFIEGNPTVVYHFPQDYRIGKVRPAIIANSLTIWGGGVPQDPWYRWGDYARLRASDRPLNRYLTPGVSWDDPRRVDYIGNPLAQQLLPMNLPEVFKCPSDGIRDSGYNDWDFFGDVGRPAWSAVGASYATTDAWVSYYRLTSLADDETEYEGDALLIAGGKHERGTELESLSVEMFRNSSGRWASEFVLMAEAPFNVDSQNRRPSAAPGKPVRPVVGFHGEQDKHAVLYLDSHARYDEFSRPDVRGPNWTLWPGKPWEGHWAQFNGE